MTLLIDRHLSRDPVKLAPIVTDRKSCGALVAVDSQLGLLPLDLTANPISEIILIVTMTLVVCLVGWHLHAASRRERIRELEEATLRLGTTAEDQRQLVDDLLKRNRVAEETVVEESGRLSAGTEG